MRTRPVALMLGALWACASPTAADPCPAEWTDHCGVCDNDPSNDCLIDCAGVEGGSAVLDGCGDCVLGTTGMVACVADCRGDFGGAARLDNCGTCDSDPTNDCPYDCLGELDGPARLDACGTCDADPGNDCVQDCAGTFGGIAVIDACGECVGGATGRVACAQDCLGVWGGAAQLDNCGACDADPGNDCDHDCNGAPGGDARRDHCGVCDSDATNDCVADCASVWGGVAYVDGCGRCVGGTTGLIACVQDCSGAWGGNAYRDQCGACVGGSTGEPPCARDCQGVWGGTAYIDDCGRCAGGTSGLTACVQDCQGTWGGTAYVDDCSRCVDGTTGLTACRQDCQGTWGGAAYVDGCGTCVGGTTGLLPCAQPCAGKSDGTPCGDAASACVNQDTCQGEVCVDRGFVAAGTSCGSPTDDACTDADTCNGAGACVPNHAPSGTACGTPGACEQQDTCNGAGACVDQGWKPAGTSCGSPADTDCTDPDRCDSGGNCLPSHAGDGTACGGAPASCHNQDRCQGGVCVDQGFVAVGASCGSPTDDECTNPDTCDGGGSCQPNHATSGVPCGAAPASCENQDTCSGGGACLDAGLKAPGSACGAGATSCSAADSCDASGVCLPNHLAAGAEGGCGTCQDCDGSGSCVAVPSGQSDAGCNAAAALCSGADTCNGAGACLANDHAEGTVCMSGATCQGGTCQDLNECLVDNGGCGSGYTCVNNIGYARSCVDIDECQTNNGGCSSYLTCVNNTGAPASCVDVNELSEPILVADAQNGGFGWAYAPTIMHTQGVYHAYFCSAGTSGWDWDRVRHAASTDLVTWTGADLKLVSTMYERSNCDPSIVRHNLGDGDYYYLFYSGNVSNVQTVNFVARSASPEGPFLKLAQDGSWQAAPAQSRIITMPAVPVSDTKCVLPGASSLVDCAATNVYGAGQPSVVIHNNAFYMWYTETTVFLPSVYRSIIYFTTSTNLLDWTTPVPTNVLDASSIDVKYDEASGNFVMIEHDLPHWQTVATRMRTSADGVTWSAPSVLCGASCTPDWANNIGMSGDERGHIESHARMVVAYAAPYNLDPLYNNNCALAPSPSQCWPSWNLYANVIKMGLVGTEQRYTMTSAVAKTSANVVEELWPAANALDGNPDSVFSSYGFATSSNDRGVFLLAYMGTPQPVSKLVLTGRRGPPEQPIINFPVAYTIYVTNALNTGWVPVGSFTTQPGADAVATVKLGATYTTWGVLISPTVIGSELIGGTTHYYFQLADLHLAGW